MKSKPTEIPPAVGFAAADVDEEAGQAHNDHVVANGHDAAALNEPAGSIDQANQRPGGQSLAGLPLDEQVAYMHQYVSQLYGELNKLRQHVAYYGEEQAKVQRAQMERQTRYSALQLAIGAKAPTDSGEQIEALAKVFEVYLRGADEHHG